MASISDVYRKTSNMNYQNDNEDCKVVEEVKSYEKSSPELARSDFITSDNKVQESTLDQTEDENGSKRLNLLNENPLTSEKNPVFPIDEEGFMEENQEDAFEANRILDENFENVHKFLSIDTSLFSSESVIVSQQGNPLDGLPFEYIYLDISNQRKDRIAKSAIECSRRITSSDDAIEEAVSDSRLNKQNICEPTSKYDLLNPSLLLENNEHQNPSEETSFSLPGGSQTGSTRTDRREQSRTKIKKSPLKQSPKKTYPCGEYGKIFSSKVSYADHMLLQEHEKSTDGPTIVLSSCSQTGSSRPDPSGHSGNEAEEISLKHSSEKIFLCDRCGEILYSTKSLENHILFHENQNASEEASVSLPGSSQTGSSETDIGEHSRIKTEKSLLKPSPKESLLCGEYRNMFSSDTVRSDDMALHQPQNTYEEPSVTLPCGNQTGPSKEDHSLANASTQLDEDHCGQSRFISKLLALKISPKEIFPCCECKRIFFFRRSYEIHIHCQHKPAERSSPSLSSGSPAGTSGPDHSDRSRTLSKKSPSKH